MSKLVCFGCSYTVYVWPTWADLLSLSYDHYENWAIPGLGNQAIFERFIEAQARDSFSKDDVIIIQWSTHLRHDWFSRLSLKSRISNWKTSGSMFSEGNEDIFDDQWRHLFFDEFAYVMHTYNFILAAQNILDKIGCKWFMTSIGDIRKLGSDLLANNSFGENIQNTKIQTQDLYPDLYFYEEIIWKKKSDKWIDPIFPFCRSYKDKFYKFKYSSVGLGEDHHPTPYLYQKWLDTWAEDHLGITMDRVNQDLIVNSVDNMYEKVGMSRFRNEFDTWLQSSTGFDKILKMQWPNEPRGFF